MSQYNSREGPSSFGYGSTGTVIQSSTGTWLMNDTRFIFPNQNDKRIDNAAMTSQNERSFYVAGNYGGNNMPYPVKQGANSIPQTDNYNRNRPTMPYSIKQRVETIPCGHSNYEILNMSDDTEQGNNSRYTPHLGSHQEGTVRQSLSPLQMLHSYRGQPFEYDKRQSLTFQNFGQYGYATFPGSNSLIHHNQAAFLAQSINQPVSQEDADRTWLEQWLKQRQIQKNIAKPIKTLKINDIQNLFQSYLGLNNQLKKDCDELQMTIGADQGKWNSSLSKAESTKEKILSVQKILCDPHIIQDFEKKIEKRKKKRLWLKNRQRRRFLERQKDEERRRVLHEKIDLWQTEFQEKDLAARKAASLKREAGGVLGEIRRKLQDSHKLQELVKSIVKLRELRKSEGEKKGVYPRTSSSEDGSFTSKCDYVEKMIERRMKTYEEEEKALRVIIMEEADEREKQEKQQRLEQKAMLNLSKEADPLAEYRRYYTQADESIQYLIQIRRDWDIYLTPDVTLGSRVPDEDITAASPTNTFWASFLQSDGQQQEKGVK